MAILMEELAGDLLDLVDGLYHMHRNANGASLVRNGAGDGLTNPPGCIGGELKAFGMVKLLNRLDQAEVALLNEVKELHSAAHIPFSNGNDETKVCLTQALLSLFALFAACLNGKSKVDFLLRSEQRDAANLFKVDLNRVINGDAIVGQRILEIIHAVLSQVSRLGSDIGHVLVHYLDAVGFQLLIELFHLFHINAAAAFLHGVTDFSAGQFADAASLVDQSADGIFLFCHK